MRSAPLYSVFGRRIDGDDIERVHRITRSIIDTCSQLGGAPRWGRVLNEINLLSISGMDPYRD